MRRGRGLQRWFVDEFGEDEGHESDEDGEAYQCGENGKSDLLIDTPNPFPSPPPASFFS